MIETDEQLSLAQQAVMNLQSILLAARKTHTPAEYRCLAEPILLEIQQREQDTLTYLSRTKAEPAAV